MYDDSFESVSIILSVNFMIILYAITGVWEEIHLLREAAICVEFEFLHGVEVELEAFEGNNQHIGWGFETHTFDCFYFAIAALAEIGILALEHLAFDELL